MYLNNDNMLLKEMLNDTYKKSNVNIKNCNTNYNKSNNLYCIFHVSSFLFCLISEKNRNYSLEAYNFLNYTKFATNLNLSNNKIKNYDTECFFSLFKCVFCMNTDICNRHVFKK